MSSLPCLCQSHSVFCDGERHSVLPFYISADCNSYVEESNADKAIKALTAALAPKARVKRDGKVSSVDASELVPGDIIIIQFGNIVPADIKLLGEEGEEDQPLQVRSGFKPHPQRSLYLLLFGVHADGASLRSLLVCEGKSEPPMGGKQDQGRQGHTLPMLTSIHTAGVLRLHIIDLIPSS
jgi:hypothetical protein